jgi:hypothetical protein
MSIIRKNSHNYLVELIITLAITGAIIFGVTYKLYGEAVRLKERTAESQTRRMTKTAYDVSVKLDGYEKEAEIYAD